MSRIFLIRHGQAGLRHHYDTLSEVGAQQAECLRNWVERESLRFHRIVAGGLTRQKETARLAAGEPEVDPRFSEFDLDAVYRSLAPILCEQDPQFRAEYEAMRTQMQSDDAPVHREWNRCDVKVFEAWYAGRYPVEAETWTEFKARVLSSLAWLRAIPPQEQVAIFTSATPIGLLVAAIFDAHDGRAMRLAGACYNSAVTTLRVHDGDLSLMGFNSVAHLPDPALRTFR